MAYKKTRELEALGARYPEVSPFILLKISMVRHGAVLSPRVIEAVQNEVYSFGALDPFGIDYVGRTREKAMPGAILLRDASNVYINYGEAYEDPYTIDFDEADGVFVLYDGDREIDTLDFVPRPRFFGKKTRRGTPMEALADVRAQKLILNAHQHCRLWEGGQQCQFCAFFTKGQHVEPGDPAARGIVDPEDIYETVREALSERGRYSELYLSGGLDFGGAEPFDDEVDRYIRILKAVGRNFKGRFSSQLMAPAYTEKQVRRLYEETGLTSYCPNIEVWDKEKFAWLCPGKEKWIGRDEWIRRTLDAVGIFGRGNVYTQVVAGAELASPNGFGNMEEALASNFEACEFFSKHGVVFLSTIWRPHRSARLGMQPMPPVEYYVRLAKGLHDIRKSYGIVTYNDDYKHCGNHPDADLERVD